jgi:hypothetical protein
MTSTDPQKRLDQIRVRVILAAVGGAVSGAVRAVVSRLLELW